MKRKKYGKTEKKMKENPTTENRKQKKDETACS